ncbi:MAG: type III secretion system cytoplasmic ring protein SctQ [Myxococcaceae bacterium]
MKSPGRMERSLTQTVRVSNPQTLGTRKLTRAHLSLARRGAVLEAAHAALDAVAERLTRELDVPVKAHARLVDAVVSPTRSLSALSGFVELELSSLSESALLEVELPFLAAILARLSSASAVQDAAFALTRLEEAAFGYLSLAALAAVRANPILETLCSPRLVRVHTHRAQALALCSERWRWLAVELSLQVGEDRGRARLLLPAQPLQSALAGVEESAAQEIAPEVLRATVPARVRVGRTELDRASSQTLAPGDVILLDTLRRGERGLLGPARISLTGFELQGELTAEGFQLSSALPSGFPQENPMVDAPLSVEVEVELARVRLTVAELARLRPGAILSLRCNAAEPVSLWIGDRAVARAELVDVEGELGARILSLNP